MRIATFRQPQVVCEPSKPQLGAEMSCFHDTFDLCLRVQGLWLEEYCMSFKGQHSTGFSQRFTQWNFSSQAIKFQHVSTIDVPRNQPIAYVHFVAFANASSEVLSACAGPLESWW